MAEVAERACILEARSRSTRCVWCCIRHCWTQCHGIHMIGVELGSSPIRLMSLYLLHAIVYSHILQVTVSTAGANLTFTTVSLGLDQDIPNDNTERPVLPLARPICTARSPPAAINNSLVQRSWHIATYCANGLS